MRSKNPRQPDLAGPPAPRFATAWASLAYAVGTLLLGWPALAGRFLVNPLSDQFSGFAYREFGAAVLRETGGFAQWNPYILGGLPYAAAQHGDIFYPTFILRLLLPVDQALTWSFLIHLFLAGLFTYAFLRAWGLGFFPSLVGGAAYMLSGQIASYVSPGHDGKMYVSALAPLVLWMIVRGMRDGRIWAWGVLAVATGLCVLSPHYQMTYYLGVLAGGFTLWLAFRKGEDALDRRTALVRLGWGIGAAVLGLAIGGIQFWPFFEYLPFAARGVERGWKYATSYSMPPEELINTYLPQFSGIVEHYWGRNPLKLHSDYLGAAALVLAGAGLGSPRRGFRWFWIGATIVALLVALGGHTPFYQLWYQLPMMKVVRAPGMVFFLVSLATGVFAALGTERLLAGQVGQRYLIGWGIAALVVGGLATIGFFNAIGTGLADPGRADFVDANRGAVVAGAWRSFLFVAATLAALIGVQRGKLRPDIAGWVLAALVLADLWSVERLYFRWSPPARVLYAADPAVEYLKAHTNDGRVLVLDARVLGMPTSPTDTAQNDPFLNGDALMIHRVRAATGHQGNELQRWVALAGAKSPAPPPNFASPQWRRLANVRYWLTNTDLPEEIPQAGMRLARRAGPVKNALGSTVSVYEFLEDNPAAWVAPAMVKADTAAIRATLLDPRFDARRVALFEPDAAVQGVQLAELPPPLPIRATVTRPSATRIDVALDTPAPAGSAVVVSENWYPGWSATVDGSAVRAERADYTLIGVPLPAGARSVSLSFRDPAYGTGKLVTIAALLVAALVVAYGVSRERQRG